jgi:hypothetical protein
MAWITCVMLLLRVCKLMAWITCDMLLLQVRKSMARIKCVMHERAMEQEEPEKMEQLKNFVDAL